MLVSEVLTELGHRGVSLFPKGDRLRFWPKSALTPELLGELGEHKAEILVALGKEPVRSASEVLETTRAYLGPSRPFNPDEHPPTKKEIWTDLDKERFFFPHRHPNGGDGK